MASRRVAASVPGKVILIGEHAAVYGSAALVAAIDRRVTVEVETGSHGVVIDLESFSDRRTVEWREAREYALRAERQWRAFESTAGTRYVVARGTGREHVVLTALGEAARDLGSEPPPMQIRVVSDLPIGSGFGSSAAVAVATIAAVFCFLGEGTPRKRIARLALEVERRQHGRPSGVDHTAVMAGGVVEVSGDEILAEIPITDFLRRRFELRDTGAPSESTGEVVAAVARFREENRTEFDTLLARMESAVAAFKRQLATASPRSGEVGEAIRSYESCLESLAVVPASVRRAIRAVEACGGAAKISGAGTLTGDGAGCLLTLRPTAQQGPIDAVLAPFPPIATEFGAEGLLCEELP